MAAAVSLGCGTGTTGAEAPIAHSAAGGGAECAGRTRAQNLMPGIRPEEATLDYWLHRYSERELDAVLMDADQIAAYDARV
ncbi:MAG TPA: hypothetical protein VHZ95_20230, partial [Polyangiales bacterium]|nr:hypothetical protein [Polyangiales bacterium]